MVLKWRCISCGRILCLGPALTNTLFLFQLSFFSVVTPQDIGDRETALTVSLNVKTRCLDSLFVGIIVFVTVIFFTIYSRSLCTNVVRLSYMQVWTEEFRMDLT